MRSKRTIWLTVVGLCILSLLVGAWVAPPLEAKEKEITLIWATYYPPSYVLPGKPYAPIGDFVDNVNKLGEGKVKINAYWSGELLDARQLIPGLQRGTADIIGQTGTYTTGAWPVMAFAELPFFWRSTESYCEHMKMGGDIRNIVDEEMERKHGMKLIAFATITLEPLWLGNKRVEKPEDLRGLKIRSAGIGQAWALKAFGAAPIGMVSAEMYEGMSRGTIDGLLTVPGTIYARKLYEVTKYCLDGSFAADSIAVVMKKEKWDALPRDVRDIITKAVKIFEEELPSYDLKRREEYFAEFRKGGMEIAKLSPEGEEAFRTVARKAWENYAEKVGPELAEKIFKLAGH
ncbi:MAG: TRAP transporter substrate-binding protein [Pseudomonadota bacterium]